MNWFIELRLKDGTLFERFGPFLSERTAQRADTGLNRNLDLGRFYTVVTNSTGKGC